MQKEFGKEGVGYAVNEYIRLLPNPNIFAVGDVACYADQRVPEGILMNGPTAITTGGNLGRI